MEDHCAANTNRDGIGGSQIESKCGGIEGGCGALQARMRQTDCCVPNPPATPGEPTPASGYFCYERPACATLLDACVPDEPDPCAAEGAACAVNPACAPLLGGLQLPREADRTAALASCGGNALCAAMLACHESAPADKVKLTGLT